MSLLLIVGLAFASHAWAFATPKIPVEDDMTITVVADHMDFNGVQMAGYEVHSRRRLSEVVDFYKSAWKGSVAVSEMQVDPGSGPWTVLSHRDGDYLITIQLQPDEPSGCSGFAAVSDAFSGKQRHQAENFPMPAGSKVINDIAASDPGKHSRTLVLQNNDSVQSNLDFYRAQLQRQGWSEIGNTDEAGLPQQWQGQQALLMNRDGDQINLAVAQSDAGTSTVVIVSETR